MEMVEILPASVEIKYDYLNIEGIYVSTLTIIKYETNINILSTIETLIGNQEIEVSFHIIRENSFEILKKLTNIIAESKSEINSVSKNQLDINILESMKNKAIELRKKIQVDNEQIYKLSTYVVVKATNIEELLVKQKKYVNMLYSKQIVAKPSNFRQKDAYIATLPMLENNQMISKHTHSVFTEKAISKLFPFFVTDVINNNGIMLGKANNNLCLIDMFSEKNNNYNMCVFGTSGAGKSYFVKLMIIRNAYKGVRQIIIDPEGEYVELVESLGGHVYTNNNYNPFEIAESYLKEENFFNKKITQIIEYIENNVEIRDKTKLAEYIEKTYNKFGINENVESLYNYSSQSTVYIKPRYIKSFPTMDDLFLTAGNDMDMEAKILSNGKKYTSVNSNIELYCFNLKGRGIDEIINDMKMFMPKIYELITSQTLIYFDEIWKSIGLGQDRYVIENVYNMFKTLRKRKAGVIAISQDIGDLFTLDGGNFGKSILNNTNIKVLFKMEWNDIEMFQRILQTRNIEKNIRTLTRGNAYVTMGNTSFNLEVKATKYEHKLIEGEDYEENINSDEQ